MATGRYGLKLMAHLLLQSPSWYWGGQTLKHLAWSQQHHTSLLQLSGEAPECHTQTTGLPYYTYHRRITLAPFSMNMESYVGHFGRLCLVVCFRFSVELWKQSIFFVLIIAVCIFSMLAPPVAKSVTQHNFILSYKATLNAFRWILFGLTEWTLCLQLSEECRYYCGCGWRSLAVAPSDCLADAPPRLVSWSERSEPWSHSLAGSRSWRCRDWAWAHRERPGTVVRNSEAVAVPSGSGQHTQNTNSHTNTQGELNPLIQIWRKLIWTAHWQQTKKRKLTSKNAFPWKWKCFEITCNKLGTKCKILGCVPLEGVISELNYLLSHLFSHLMPNAVCTERPIWTNMDFPVLIIIIIILLVSTRCS